MAMNCYNKWFISEINSTLQDEKSNLDISRILMKSSVLGIVTAIKKYSRRTVFSVDDGTGSLDCVLWHKEPPSKKITNELQKNLDSQNLLLSIEASATCRLFLNKIEMNEDETECQEYVHGDIICCLGNVKLVKGKLLIDIKHHYKVDNVNSEALWILDVLSCKSR